MLGFAAIDMQTGVERASDSAKRCSISDSKGLGSHTEANQIGSGNNDQNARPKQAHRPAADAGPLAEGQAYKPTTEHVHAHVQDRKSVV